MSSEISSPAHVGGVVRLVKCSRRVDTRRWSLWQLLLLPIEASLQRLSCPDQVAMLPKAHGSLVDLRLLGATHGAIGTQWPEGKDVPREYAQEA